MFSFSGQLVPQIEELAHLYRIEFFSWFQAEISRDICQVVVEAVPLTVEINSVHIPDALGPDEGIDRCGSDYIISSVAGLSL